MKLFKTYGAKWLGFSRYFPYPLRAARITIDISPFSFWRPTWDYRKDLTENQKANGHNIWQFRIAFFQVSYGRWI